MNEEHVDLVNEPSAPAQKKKNGGIVAAAILLALMVAIFVFYCVFFAAINDFLSGAPESSAQAFGFALAAIAVLPILLAIEALTGVLVLIFDTAGAIISAKIIRRERGGRRVFGIVTVSLFGATALATILLFSLIFILH